jgi:hypothetical protein
MIEQKRMHLVLSVQFLSIQCLHWFLLILMFLLDNVARFLNVEHEMAEIAAHKEKQSNVSARSSYYIQDPYRFIDQHNKQKKPTYPSIDTSYEEPPVLKTTSTLVSPSSPVHSPTPNFVVRQQKDESRVRIRSYSNNMVDQRKPISPQKLRRITAQREITVQNAVLPIPRPKQKTHSIVSHSSSGSSTKEPQDFNRPRMQKTMSLSTAQQYHQKHHNEVSSDCKKKKIAVN